MHVLSTLSLGLFASLASGWTLQDDYGNDSSFFDKFTFFTDQDPTNGYVTYVDEGTASSTGLISANGGTVHIGVDNTTQVGSGRNSVRISSTNTYSAGTLVILDLAHMPGSACGSWPAFWMLGTGSQPWPAEGEIDIIEFVNQPTQNQMTLHTGPGCTVTNSGSGTLSSGDCNANDNGNAGCGVADTDSSSYGDGFNAAGGGVYATQWADDGISVWFFSRPNIPASITSGSPDPTQWGTPVASFGGSDCQFSTTFQNMQILFDITFCGDWAGAADSFTCGGGSTCQDYVGSNGDQYSETYWEINSLKVYNDGNSSVKRDISEVPHAHAAQHLNNRRTNPHARPAPRPNRSQRRGGLKLAQ